MARRGMEYLLVSFSDQETTMDLSFRLLTTFRIIGTTHTRSKSKKSLALTARTGPWQWLSACTIDKQIFKEAIVYLFSLFGRASFHIYTAFNKCCYNKNAYAKNLSHAHLHSITATGSDSTFTFQVYYYFSILYFNMYIWLHSRSKCISDHFFSTSFKIFAGVYPDSLSTAWLIAKVRFVQLCKRGAFPGTNPRGDTQYTGAGYYSGVPETQIPVIGIPFSPPRLPVSW